MNNKYYSLLLIFLTIAFASQAQWTALTGPPGGNAVDLEIDGTNKLYTIINQKIYTSANSGASWTPLAITTPTSNFYPDDLLISGGSLFALTYYQLWRSDDGGANWQRVNANTTSGQFYGVYKIIKVATNTFAIYGWNGVYVSVDDGVNWSKVDSYNTNSVVKNNAGDIFIADTQGIRKHAFSATAAGWAEANLATVYSRLDDYSMQLFAKPGGAIFASTSDDLLKSATGNAGSWASTKSNITDTYFSYCEWAFNSTDSKIYFINNNSRKIYSTSTDGTSWTALAAWPSATQDNANINRLMFTSATAAFAATNGNAVWSTANTGAAWTQVSTGLNFPNGRNIEITNSGKILYQTSYSKGIWTSTNAGSTWTYQVVSATETFLKMLKMPNNTTFLLYGQGPIHYSTDGAGVTWTSTTEYFNDISFNTLSSTTLYGCAYNRIASSTNGSTWTNLTITGVPTTYNGYQIAVDNTGLIYMYLYNYDSGNAEVWKVTMSTATTGTAVKVDVPFTSDDSGLVGFFVNNNKVYCATYYNIYVSADQGANWNRISFSSSVAFGLEDGARKGICASVYGTLYVTQDDGQTWVSAKVPDQNSVVFDVAVDASGDFYAAASNSSALKNTANLLVDPATLPPYIDFAWQPTNGPYGGSVDKIVVDASNNTFGFSSNEIIKTTTFTSWSTLPISASYYITDIDAAGSTVYANTYNGLFSSTNGGSTWTSVNSENIGGRYGFKRCPNGNMVMVTSDGGGTKVYVSTDGGTSFGTAKHTFASDEYYYTDGSPIVVSGTNVIYIRYYKSNQGYQYIKSTDAGATWNSLTLPNNSGDPLSSDASGNIYCVQYSDIYKSADNGTTWTSIKGNFDGGIGNYARIYVGPGGALYFPGGSGAISLGIWKSADGGATWTFQTTTSPGSNTWVYDLKWVGTRMVVATNRGIATSDDDGVTFTPRNAGITGYYFSDIELASPTSLLVQAGGLQFKSTDFQNWTAGTREFTKYTRKPDGTLIGFNCDEIWQSNDAGVTWTKISQLPQGCIQELTTLDGISYYAVTYDKIFYTNNLAAWTELVPTGLPAQNNYNFSDIAADVNGLLYVQLYNYTTNNQEAYQILFGSALKINGLTNPRNIEYRNNETIIYDGNGAIFITADGSTWTQGSAPAGERLIIASNGYYFVPVYGGKLWLSRDEGQTWQNIGLASGQSNYSFKDIIVNEFNGYAYAVIDRSVVRKSAVVVIPNDATNPVVAALSPANNSTGTSVKPTLSITFDEAVIPVAGKKVRILDLANPIAPLELIDVSAGVQTSKTFSFTPTIVLDYSKTYFIIVDNGSFTDIFGNAYAGIASNATWRFTTKAAPALTSLAPANNATGVNLNANLTITYSEPVRPVPSKHMYVYDAAQPSLPLTTITFGAIADEFVSLHPSNAAADQSVIVRFDATKGGRELIGASKVYMHAGLNNSWSYAKGDWGQDNGVGQMTKVTGESDLWEITLTPTLRSYFGAAANFNIQSLAVVFRNGDGTSKATPPATIAGATIAENGDVFLAIDPSSTPNCSSTPLKSGNSLIITPCTTFEFGKQYFAKFEAGALTTQDGGTLTTMPTANTDWVFSIRAMPNYTAVVPAHNATNVNIGTTLQVTFSEALSAKGGKSLYVYKVSDPANPVATLGANGAVSGNTYTYTLPAVLDYNTQFFVKFDASSFTTSDGGLVSTLTNDTDWRFTTQLSPDVDKPVITFTAPDAFTLGSTNKLTVTITDNREVASAKIHYRGVLSTGSFVEADLVKNISTGLYEITVSDGWLDELGLEYHFTAADATGNTATSPLTGEHDTRISFPDANAPEIPALPSGGTVGSYRIIAVPHELSNKSVSSVFSELGEADKKLYRLLTYNNANDDWSEYPADFSAIDRGVGYFINVKNGITLAMEGAKTPSATKTSGFAFTLKPGWNQIGNPFPFDISASAIKGANSSLGEVKTFNGNYVNATVVKAFEGAFIFNNSQSNVAVNLSVSSKSGRTQDENDDDFSAGWKVPIKLVQGDRENNFGGVGMHPEASSGFDRFDDVTPPRFIEFVDIKFAHPEHPLRYFAQDVVPPASEYVWSFTIESNVKGEATLVWDNSRFSGTAEIYLYDEARNLPLNMLQVNRHSFNPAESKTFKIYYGENVKAKMLPDHVKLGSVYPNPSNGNFAIFAFSLPESGGIAQHVRIEITDILGRPITVVKDGVFAPGHHEARWESISDKLSDGLYLFRLSVQNLSGKESLNGKLTIKQ